MKGKIKTLSLNTNKYHEREGILYSMKLQKEPQQSSCRFWEFLSK